MHTYDEERDERYCDDDDCDCNAPEPAKVCDGCGELDEDGWDSLSVLLRGKWLYFCATCRRSGRAAAVKEAREAVQSSPRRCDNCARPLTSIDGSVCDTCMRIDA